MRRGQRGGGGGTGTDVMECVDRRMGVALRGAGTHRLGGWCGARARPRAGRAYAGARRPGPAPPPPPPSARAASRRGALQLLTLHLTPISLRALLECVYGRAQVRDSSARLAVGVVVARRLDRTETSDARFPGSCGGEGAGAPLVENVAP